MTETASQLLPAVRRWALRIVASLLVLFSLAVGALALVLGHIGQPFIKQRIVAAAAASGIGLDFDEAQVSLRAAHLGGLRISQPRPDADAEPLLAIDRIDVSYSFWRAVAGGRLKIYTGEIQGVRAALFVDSDGSSSITRLLAAMPESGEKPAPKKPTPLSTTLAELANQHVSIDAFTVREVSALLISREAGREVARLRAFGLELTASDVKGALHLLLATPPAGAQALEKRGDAERALVADGRIELTWSARGQAPRGDLGVDVKLREQALLQLPPQAPAIGELVHLKAAILPEPAKHRTRLTVGELRLLDGAASGHFDVELADQADGGVQPVIHQAALDLALDPFRLFLPPAFGELTALSGTVQLEAADVDLSQGLRIAPQGHAELRALLPRLAFHSADASAEISRAKLELTAKPVPDGVSLELKLPLESARAAAGGRTFELSHALLAGSARANAAYRATGKITLALASLHAGGAQELDASGAELRLELKDADLAAPGPLHFAGGAALEGAIAELAVKSQGPGATLTGLKLMAPLQLKANGSGSGELHLDAAQLALSRGGRALGSPAPLAVDLRAAHFAYDAAAPARSTADAQLELALGAASAQLHLDKRARDLSYELTAKAATLAQVAPFVAARPGAQIPWAQMGLSLSSQGSAENLASLAGPKIAQETTLQLTRAALHGDFELSSDTLVATLKSQGTARAHEGDLTLRLAGLSVQGEAPAGDESLALHAVVDLAQPKAQLQFAATGAACPEGKVALALAYERAAARVTYAVEGELHHFDLVPLLLPPALLEHTDLEWSTLGVSLSGKGNLDGLVTSLRDLKPVLAREPLRSLRGEQALDFAVRGLDYANDDDQALVLSSAQLHLEASETAAQRRLGLTFSSPQGQADGAGVEAKFEGLTGALSVALGAQSLRAQLHLGAASLKQDAQPAYPIGDASMDLLATAAEGGTLQLEEVKLDNPAGGTSLRSAGEIEALLRFADGLPHLRPISTGGSDPRDLRLSGEVTQQLSALSPRMGATGRGVMKIPFGAESGDFHFFRVTTGLEFVDADLDFTDRKLSLKRLNAKIPVKLQLRLDERGTLPLGGARSSAYSRARFVDYQPFLASEDFISCDELRVGDSTVGPIAANLRVDRNLIALDQLEMTAFGGKLTGQLILDVDMGERQLTDVRFRGDVTGLAPSRGDTRSSDVVNANAALRLNPRRLELEGRIDIVSIGRDDLNATLDAWDPYHADPSANRSRRALSVGYPKHVRLGFHEGFTEIAIEMGGMAGAAGIDPIQVPTGPLLEKYVEPYLKLMKPTAPPKGTP